MSRVGWVPDGLLKTMWVSESSDYKHRIIYTSGDSVMEAFCGETLVIKQEYMSRTSTRAPGMYFLRRIPTWSLLSLSHSLLAGSTLCHRWLAVKMPADAPRVSERKQNAAVRQWGGFSELSASIQSAQKTSKERIELLLCVCYTVIPGRRPLCSSAAFPPHIRTRWRLFIQIPGSEPNGLMWCDNHVRMTRVKRKTTTKGIASEFSWPLQKRRLLYIINE